MANAPQDELTFCYPRWFVAIFAGIALFACSFAAYLWVSAIALLARIITAVIAAVGVFHVAQLSLYRLTLTRERISVYGLCGCRFSHTYSDIESGLKDSYGTISLYVRGWSTLSNLEQLRQLVLDQLHLSQVTHTIYSPVCKDPKLIDQLRQIWGDSFV